MKEAAAIELAHPERKSNFYFGFLFLPKPRREALNVVYGFCRLMDDIVDSGSLKPEEAQKLLDFWRAEVQRIYEDKPTHSLSRQLIPYVKEYHLPRQAFLDLIRGVEMDLTKQRYETFEELESYLYGVAVTVGLLCVEIFGHQHSAPEQVRDYARKMGYAFQLTNIIRDVGADLEHGRVYLPQKDIADAGYSMDDLMHRRQTPEFRSLMDRQYDKAKILYQRARNILDPQDRLSMIAGEIMACVYEDLLDEIKSNGYPVLHGKTSLSTWGKVKAAMRGVMYSYGIH